MHIIVNGARIFFDVAGATLSPGPDGPVPRPALLVLHGGPGFDHWAMRDYFDRFADQLQVVYLDHRGNGRSRGGNGSDPTLWNLAQWGDDIAAFCDALGLVRPIVLGQSFGGMVAQSYAARHPGQNTSAYSMTVIGADSLPLKYLLSGISLFLETLATGSCGEFADDLRCMAAALIPIAPMASTEAARNRDRSNTPNLFSVSSSAAATAWIMNNKIITIAEAMHHGHTI